MIFWIITQKSDALYKTEALPFRCWHDSNVRPSDPQSEALSSWATASIKLKNPFPEPALRHYWQSLTSVWPTPCYIRFKNTLDVSRAVAGRGGFGSQPLNRGFESQNQKSPGFLINGAGGIGLRSQTSCLLTSTRLRAPGASCAASTVKAYALALW